MNKTTLSLLLLVSLAGPAAAQAGRTPAQGPQGIHITTQAERERQAEAFHEAVEAGIKAEARGDYAEAERRYRESCFAFGHDDPFDHIRLAFLYDKRGLERKAMVEYRIVLVGGPTGSSSSQTDPRILSRFGDLCTKYGSVKEAKAAYALAARQSDRDENGDEPNSAPRNDTLSALKAAAHTAAAIEHGSHGQKEDQMRELDAAVLADGGYWVARYYRAREYRRAGKMPEATREAAVAERLATPKGRAQVAELRKDFGIPKG